VEGKSVEDKYPKYPRCPEGHSVLATCTTTQAVICEGQTASGQACRPSPPNDGEGLHATHEEAIKMAQLNLSAKLRKFCTDQGGTCKLQRGIYCLPTFKYVPGRILIANAMGVKFIEILGVKFGWG
jgi:hypothetical protein